MILAAVPNSSLIKNNKMARLKPRSTPKPAAAPRRRELKTYAARKTLGNPAVTKMVRGQKHCDTGPAVMLADGTTEYWVDGLKHRSEGPAVLRGDGEHEFWFRGTKVSEFAHKALTLAQNGAGNGEWAKLFV